MNDIRRTILWVIFGFSLVLLWDNWQVYNGHKATFFPGPAKPAAVTTAPAPASSVPVGVVSPNSIAGAAQLPGATATIVPAAQVPAAPRERVVVTSDVLKLTLDTEGATVVQTEFLQHKDMADKSRNFVLLDDSKERTYMAQTGLIGGTDGNMFPTHKTVMNLISGERTLKDGGQELVIRFESPELGGVKLVKTFTLTRGVYAVAVKHEVVNVGTAPATPQLYLQLVRDGNKPKGESSFYSTFTGPAVYTDAQKYQKVEFADIEKNKVEIEKSAENGYVAMVQHYFASAWVLGDEKKGDRIQRDLFMRKVDTNLYAVGMITSIGSLAPGASRSVDAKFFAGPQEEKDA
jgi:YidC/Oxa1 family membrane protein insertase